MPGKMVTIDVADAYAAGLVNSSQIAELIAENHKDNLVLWFYDGCNGRGLRYGPLMKIDEWLKEHGFDPEYIMTGELPVPAPLAPLVEIGLVKVEKPTIPDGYVVVKIADECQEEVLILKE